MQQHELMVVGHINVIPVRRLTASASMFSDRKSNTVAGTEVKQSGRWLMHLQVGWHTTNTVLNPNCEFS